MATPLHTAAKRISGLVLAGAMAASLAVIGCGSLAAESGVGGPTAPQVVRDPENPNWVGATVTAAESAQIHDPENPYWVGNTSARFDNGIDSSRQSGPR